MNPTSSSSVPTTSSSGCGKVPAPGNANPAGEVSRSIRSGGAARAYRLEVPANYNRNVAAPLVFNFHGYPANAAFQSAYSDLPKVGHERGHSVVTPGRSCSELASTEPGTGDS